MKLSGLNLWDIKLLPKKTEVIALTQVLRPGKGKTINVYTDRRYGFATVHVHGALYKKRRLLTSGKKDIKNAEGDTSFAKCPLVTRKSGYHTLQRPPEQRQQRQKGTPLPTKQLNRWL